MRNIILGFAAISAMSAITIGSANAQSTCSGMRSACLKGVTGRAVTGSFVAACHGGYEGCMKTGIWDTTMYGNNGKRKAGMVKK